VVSASLGQLSAIRADNSEGAGYGAEASAYAGSNEVFDEGSSEPLVRFGLQVALSRSRGEAITSGSHDRPAGRWRTSRALRARRCINRREIYQSRVNFDLLPH
jgi:hypothetical protein